MLIMQFQEPCIYCNKAFVLTITHIGHSVSCPHCQKSFFIKPPFAVPFSEADLQYVLQNEPPELYAQICQIPRQNNWPVKMLAMWMESRLSPFLQPIQYSQTYSKSIVGKLNLEDIKIIVKAYLQIVANFNQAIVDNYRMAIDDHSLSCMVNIITALQTTLDNINAFYAELEQTPFPPKEPFDVLLSYLYSWKGEFYDQILTVIERLKLFADMDIATVRFTEPQISLAPASIGTVFYIIKRIK